MYGAKCTIFTNHKSLQDIFDQKQLNMRQRRWFKLINIYECDIRYHHSKENIVAGALSRNEHIKTRRVGSLTMTSH